MRPVLGIEGWARGNVDPTVGTGRGLLDRVFNGDGIGFKRSALPRGVGGGCHDRHVAGVCWRGEGVVTSSDVAMCFVWGSVFLGHVSCVMDRKLAPGVTKAASFHRIFVLPNIYSLFIRNFGTSKKISVSLIFLFKILLLFSFLQSFFKTFFLAKLLHGYNIVLNMHLQIQVYFYAIT